MNSRSQLTRYLLLVAVPVFFFLWKLSAFGLIGADEPRYAQVAREMLERHDWVTPMLGGVPWLEKPPLYYWQAMIAYKLFGVTDWSARLPSVFDAFLLVLAVYFFLRRFSPGTEVDGALITATCAGMVGFARAASTDMPLAAMFSIAMLAWYSWLADGPRRYLAAFYIFLALAMLAKGPVAPFLAFAIILIFAGLRRRRTIIWNTLWIPGIVIFLAIALPWYVLVQLRNPQFFHEFIVEHNLARFGTNLYHHPEPFWYYLPVTLLGWVPWCALVLAMLVWCLRRRQQQPESFNRFLVLWIAIVVIFFSASKSKLPGYVLPAVPAGAVLATEFIAANRRGEGLSGWARPVVAGIHSAVLATLLFCALLISPLLLHNQVFTRATLVPLIASIIVGAGIFISLTRSNFRALRLATLFPLILTLALALRLGAQPLDETLSARPVSNLLGTFDPHHLPLAVLLVPRETEFGLAFYRNQAVARYELHQVPKGEHLVVAARGFEKTIYKVTGRKPTLLAAFAPQKLEIFYVPAQ